jgi:hypothetical protein
MWISSDLDPNSRWQIEHSRKWGGRDCRAFPIIGPAQVFFFLHARTAVFVANDSVFYIFTVLQKMKWEIVKQKGQKTAMAPQNLALT